MGTLKGHTVGLILLLTGGIERIRLERASRQPDKVAARTLRRILFSARNTVYGKEHNFADILSAEDDEELIRRFRSEVVPGEYENFAPYVELCKRGRKNVLVHGSPALYATTSGSTADPKWIPIAHKYIRDIYRKMSRLWLSNFFLKRHKVFDYRVFSVVGPLVEGYAPDGTPYGSVSGLAGRDCPPLIRELYTNPSCVYNIKDYNSRYYVLMRMAIEHKVGIMVTANPSTLVELSKNTARYFDSYIEDIEKGTISSEMIIEDDIRRELEGRLKPNPARAEFLRSLKERYGIPRPKHFWPELQVLCTWKCGNTRVYIDKVKEDFPENVFYQELGYFSTECRFGLVLDDTLNTVLFPHFHFYEFVPEEEIGSTNPRFLLPSELEEGKRYCPYVTTASGLYRYSMNDIVEAGPKFRETPTVHMIQKLSGIVSLTGEKLYERQFIAATRDAADEIAVPLRFFIGFGAIEESRYHFYFEMEKEDATEEDAARLAAKVDSILRKNNIEYGCKRDSLRLETPAHHLLVKDSYEKFKKEWLERGARDGQFKLGLLLQDDKRHEVFRELVKQ